MLSISTPRLDASVTQYVTELPGLQVTPGHLKLQMNLALILLLLFETTAVNGFRNGRPIKGFVGSPKGTSRKKYSVSEQWFPQILDHFSEENTFWKQRFLSNREFYEPGGPVFLMLGGEGKANKKWMSKGTWIEYSKRFGAACYLLEHRYYGESHPVNNLSVKNLKYLSSKQAIYDIAKFVKYLKILYKDAKVVVFGGSYAGNLAAWFRLKFPQLVDAAVSTSGPVLAQLNFKEYLGVVEDALGEDCSQFLKEGSLVINNKLSTLQGCKTISNLFNVCGKPYCGERDKQNFLSNVANVFEDVVQYDKDNRDSYLTNGTNITVNFICSIMTNKSIGDPLSRLLKVVQLYGSAKQEKCFEVSYDDMISKMRKVTWSDSVADGSRQWMYQTCNEFGYFQSSDLSGNPFEGDFPVDFFLQQCQDIFGPKFTKKYLEKAIKMTNAYYHGFDVQKDSRIIFVNGSKDPWHVLSVVDKSLNNVIVIPGTAHCANMYPEREEDPPGLKSARIKIMNFIQACLEQE